MSRIDSFRKALPHLMRSQILVCDLLVELTKPQDVNINRHYPSPWVKVDGDEAGNTKCLSDNKMHSALYDIAGDTYRSCPSYFMWHLT